MSRRHKTAPRRLDPPPAPALTPEQLALLQQRFLALDMKIQQANLKALSEGAVRHVIADTVKKLHSPPRRPHKKP
jgi:hypothetical protein